MRLKKYLKEKISVDSEDWGKTGKKFENVFIKACEMVGLEFEENRYAGKAWDIKPKGDGWQKLLSNKDVNIKVSGTKWMFGSTELYKALPWEKLPEDFDEKKAEKKVKRIINKVGIDKVIFLKPKSKEIQQNIIDAVKNNDIEKLDEILVNKNFYAEKLGQYDVRVLTRDNRVSSIAIDSGGKVFMRSEKPRIMGAGAGSMMVTFRTPTSKLGKKERKIKE